MHRLGQSGIAVGGALMSALAFLMLASGLAWWLAPLAVGRHRPRLLHAAQHAADLRHADDAGSARHRRSRCSPRRLYLGQTVGVGAGGAGVRPLRRACRCSSVGGLLLPALAFWFTRELKRREQSAISASYCARARRARSRRAPCRSTMPGRLSSSQDLSIGRSISRTRSSSVRAFCTSTVCASELNAESTAADGRRREQRRSARAGQARRLPAAARRRAAPARTAARRRRPRRTARRWSGSSAPRRSRPAPPSTRSGRAHPAPAAPRRAARPARRGSPASHRCRPARIAGSAAAAAARRRERGGDGGTGARRHRRRRRRRQPDRRPCGGGFGGVVVGDDAANGGEDFLHRRLLRLRRLAHCRIPAQVPIPSASPIARISVEA